MEQIPEPEKCSICGIEIIDFAGDPFKWPITLAHPEGNGDTLDYCTGCVSEIVNQHLKSKSAPEPENKPLTWKTALDKIAEIKMGCKTWREMLQKHGDDFPDFYYAEAAELYARSKWEQGATEQRELCFRSCENNQSTHHSPEEFEEWAITVVLNAPAPQFKP